MLHIVGLGPGDGGSITIETFSLLRETNVILRTKIHPTVEFLDEWGISYISMDEYYEKSRDFEDVYKGITKKLVEYFKESSGEMTYCVPGNPMIAERSVTELISLCETEGIEYRVYPAVSFIDTILATLKRDPINGLLILDSIDLKEKGLNDQADTIITQVYNKRVASDVKLALSRYVDDEAEIIYIKSAGIRDEESVRRIPLFELDRQEDVDHLTTIFIEKENIKRGFNDFKRTVDALREPDGCPWDREQTHESLKRFMIEEAYEAIDAVDRNDMDDLCEELGDVLLQVLLNSRIAEENGYFDIGDVIRGVDSKMISRHPHVFSGLKLDTSDEVLKNWEKIKKDEKGKIELSEKLEQIPKSIPAFLRALEVAKKAATYGVKKKTYDEALNDLRSDLAKAGPESEDDMAKLLYNAAILSDSLGFEPETLLNRQVDREIKKLQML